MRPDAYMHYDHRLFKEYLFKKTDLFILAMSVLTYLFPSDLEEFHVDLEKTTRRNE